MHFPVEISQILAVLSAEAVSTEAASAEKTAEYTQAVWTDTVDTLDMVDFILETPQGKNASINVSIMNEGDLYTKYAPYFTKEISRTENQFFVEQSSSNSVSYVSFFGGDLWNITISLPTSENSTIDDFYNILLPTVFEAQE